MEDVIKVIDEICNDEIIKVVISNKKNKEFKYNKVGIQLKEKNKKEYYQIEKFTDKQVFHENIEIDELKDKILEFMKEEFKQLEDSSIIYDGLLRNYQSSTININEKLKEKLLSHIKIEGIVWIERIKWKFLKYF